MTLQQEGGPADTNISLITDREDTVAPVETPVKADQPEQLQIVTPAANVTDDPHPLSIESLKPALAKHNIADSTELLIVDYRVPDAQTILEDIERNGSPHVTYELVVLEADDNGIDIITETLSRFNSIGAIHIVSHGTDGNVQLGEDVLNSDTVHARTNSIGQWQHYLSDNADVLIYGCNVAQTEYGQAFVNLLAEITDADVAASDNLTGHSSLEADWQFEFTAGVIETEVAISAHTQQNWYATLDTVTVTTLSDVVDGDVSSIANLQASMGSDNEISLREAVLAANNSFTTPDTILLGSGVHVLDIQGAGGAAVGDLELNSSVKIFGAADGSTVIDATALSDRVFHVLNGDNTLQNLTIQGGTTFENTGGGGVLTEGGTSLEINNVIFYDNEGVHGGGIRAVGALTVNNTTFDNNTAFVDGGGLSLSASAVNINNTTISNNTAAVDGGGIYASSATPILTNVTITGNVATNGGGLHSDSANYTLNHTTITDNTVSSFGGGIRIPSGTVSVENSIVAFNTATTGSEVYGGINSLGHNIIGDSVGDSTGGTGYHTTSDSLDDTNLTIGVLTDNGGAVQTQALPTGSSAIDAASGTMVSDARGYLRVDGNNDIGAFEVDGFLAPNEAPEFSVPGPLELTENIVAAGTTDANGVIGTVVTDLDNDGNLDLIAALSSNSAIAWYQSNGDGSYTSRTVATGVAGARIVDVADLDGDGDLDLVSASEGDDTIAWFQNDGSENFTKNVITGTALRAHYVAVGDVDDDGDIDVLSASRNDDTIAWYANDGSGSFSTQIVSNTFDDARTVTTVDIDADGDLDVVAGGNGASSISLFLNDGNPVPGFTESPVVSGAGAINDLALIDMDEDGDLDIVAAESTADSVAWYENYGSQNFTRHEIASPVDGPQTVAVADYDEDGDLDIIVPLQEDDMVLWYHNDGSQNFAPEILNNNLNAAVFARAADMDGDGDTDVVVTARFADAVIVYDNPSDSLLERGAAPVTFTENGAPVVLAPTVEILDTELSATDNFNNASLSLARNNGANTDDEFTGSVLNAGNLEVSSTQIGTYTNVGGRLDITFNNNATSSLVNEALQSIGYRNNSSAPPATVQIDWTFNDGNTGAQGTGLRLSDTGNTVVNIIPVNDPPVTTVPGNQTVDEDTNLPVSGISVSDADNNLSTVRLTAAHGAIDVSLSGAASITAGINNSADLTLSGIQADINATLATLVYRPDKHFTGSDTLTVLSTDTDTDSDSANFSITVSAVNDRPQFNVPGALEFEEQIIAAGAQANGAIGVVVTDLDEDGNVDFVSALTSNSAIAWHQNNGDGSYTTIPVITSVLAPVIVDVADLDGDGDLDIASATEAADSIHWHQNDGSENFTTNLISGTAMRAQDVAVADLDGDGDIDALSASRDDDTIAWYTNDGSGNFTEQIISASFTDARTATTVDIDDDGDLDVVAGAGNGATNNISLFINDGNIIPSFSEIPVVTGVGVIRDLAFIDMDDDGDLDIAAAEATNDSIAWYENEGNQDFTRHEIAAAIDGPQSVAVADYDEDGDLDIVVPVQNDDTLLWYINDGSQNFADQTLNSSLDGVGFARAADMDGDGDTDVVVSARFADEVIIYDNQSDSLLERGAAPVTFTENGASVVLAPTVEISDTELSDADNFNNATLTLARQGGANVNDEFSGSGNVVLNAGTVEVSSVAIGTYSNVAGQFDITFNNDSTAARVNETLQSITYRNNSEVPPDNVQIVWTFTDGNTSTQGTGPSLADIGNTVVNIVQINDPPVVTVPGGQSVDEDSALDITGIAVDDVEDNLSTVRLIAANGSIDVTLSGTATVTAGANNSSDVTLSGNLIDVNTTLATLSYRPDQNFTGNDTLTVLATDTDTDTGGGNITISVNALNDKPEFIVPGLMEFEEQVIATGNTTANGAVDVVLTDLDNDGNIDIVAALSNSSAIAWYQSNGDGSYTHQIVASGVSVVRQLDVADIDGDGDLDIVSASENDDTIAWFQNDGSENFTKNTITATALRAYDVTVGDFDGDSDIDVVSASRDDQTIALYVNDGAGNFNEQILNNSFTDARSVFAIDINQDGALDIAAGAGVGTVNSVSLFINDGSGSFSENPIVGAFGAISDMAFIDLDGDSDLDIVSAEATADNISWYQNDGNESFTRQEIASGIDGPQAVAVSDFDGDGDLDIIAPIQNDDTLAWYENDGNQTFTSHTLHSDLDGVSFVRAGDLDGDGDSDVAVSVRFDDMLLLYDNLSESLLERGSSPVTYVVGGSAVTLAPTVELFDPELSLADNFDNATLTLVRSTGPNPEDEFAGSDNLSLSSGTLAISSTAIGSYTNAGGQLDITFNASATAAMVNETLQSITYRNTSSSPPLTIPIDWTFSDGNTGAQGPAAALTTDGVTVVDIVTVSNATVTEDVQSDIDFSFINFTDALNSNDSHTVTLATTSGGELTLAAEPLLVFAGNETTRTITGTLADLNAYFSNSSNFLYAHTIEHTNGNSSDVITVTIDDNRNTNSNTAPDRTLGFVNVTIDGVNDAPLLQLPDGIGVLSFDSASAAPADFASSVVHQPDGKILIAGSTGAGADADFLLTRLNADGSLDLSFGTDGYVTTDFDGGSDNGKNIVLQRDNSIVVGGQVTKDGVIQFGLARYTSTGMPDMNYGTDGKTYLDVSGIEQRLNGLAIQDDDKVVAAGWANITGNFNFLIARYNTDGTLDTSNFGNPDGYRLLDLDGGFDVGLDVKIQDNDQKIVVGGWSQVNGNVDFTVIRLNTDGTVDNSFGNSGVATTAIGTGRDDGIALTLQPDGKIILAGISQIGSREEIALVRYRTDGTLDLDFGVAGIRTTDLGTVLARSLDISLNGDKIVAAGHADTTSIILQYDANGTLDPTFGTGGIYEADLSETNELYSNVSISDDGQIVAVGQFNSGSSTDISVLGLTTDGTPDTGFDTEFHDNVIYVENGTAVVLDSDVEIFDQELSTVNSFHNASLTLARNSGVNSEDIFGFNDGNGITRTGSSLYKNGQVVATFDTSSIPGQLDITFTSAQGETPTGADVNAIAQQITYATSSDNPPDSVLINWLINDGNILDQGTGGPLTAIAGTTVEITPVNDPPTLIPLSAEAVAAYDFENGTDSTVPGGPPISVNPPAIISTADSFTTGIKGLLFPTGDNDSTFKPVSISSIPGVAASEEFSFSAQVRFNFGDGNRQWERIFDFGGGQNQDNVYLSRRAGSDDIILSAREGSTDIGTVRINNALSGIEGEWHHFGVTINSTGFVHVYIDGTEVGSTQLAGIPDYNTWDEHYIGSSNWPMDKRFQGAMDDIAIFDRALSSDEMMILANTVTSQYFTVAEHSATDTSVKHVQGRDVDGDVLTYSIQSQEYPGAFAIDASTGEITVANDTLLDFESDNTHEITVRVSDGALHDDAIYNISVSDKAELQQTVPGAQFVNEDGVLIFSNATNNAVTISDGLVVDDALLQVELTANDGVLDLSALAGINITAGAEGSSSLTILGTDTDINKALDGMMFSPDANFNGNVTLVVTTTLSAVDQLVGRYMFDGGNAINQSVGASQYGLLTGDAVTVVDPDRGEVLSLHGNGAVQIPGLHGEPENATLSAWVNLTSVPGVGAEVISLGNNLHLRLDATGAGSGNGISLAYRANGNWRTFGSGEFIEGTGWNHVAATFDDNNNRISIFLNGTQITTTPSGDSITYDRATTTVIGDHGEGGDAYDFVGLIDDARVYSRALTLTEIAQLYSTGIAGTGATITSSIPISVNALNDNPANVGSLPVEIAVIEDVQSNIDLSAINFSDVDAGSGNVTVTLATTSGGELTLNPATGLTIGGTPDARTITSSLADLNTYFDNTSNIQYLHSTQHFNGNNADSISVTINDNGNSGSAGGTDQLLGTVNVDITSVNDEQVVTTNVGAMVAEASSGNTITSMLLESTDDDHLPSELTYSVDTVPVNGTLRLGGTALAQNDTFTQADINAGIVTYDHDGSQTSSDGFGFTVDDGVGAETSGTFNITISNVNDVPVNTVPASVQVVDEDTPVNIAGISVSDDDNNLDTVRLTVGNGTLTVALSGTASISTGANGSDDLTLAGSLADINDTLATVTYQGNLHFNGADTLTVLATDATLATDSDVVDITVNSVNDEQVIATNVGATVAEASSGNTITSVLLEATDIDHLPDELTYTVDLAPANGTLRLSGTPLALNDTFTQADISAGSLTYDHDGSQTSTDAFDFSVDDGVGATTSGTFNITISNVNDAPVNTLPASVQMVDEDTPVNITGISISDDDNNLDSVRLTVGNGTLTVTLSGTASISAGTNGSNDLTLAGSLTDINDTLATVTYQGDLHFNGADTLTILATDTSLSTDSDLVNIAVNAANDEQVIATNVGTTVAEASTGNTITTVLLETTDIDHLPSQLTYTVDAAPVNGTLRLGGTALAQIDTFTQADISAGSLTYDHDGSQTSSDGFGFTVDDGVGAATSGTFNITISNVNDAPVNTVAASVQVVDEDTPINIAGISVSDDDGNLDTVRLTVGNGTLTVALSGTASISAGANGSSDLTLTGSLPDINDALATVTYQGNLHFNGADTLTVLATDATFASDSDVVSITVNSVNDEQVVATNAGATVAEASTGNTITSVLLETTDDDHFPGELTYSVDTVPVNGTLRLGGTALAQNDTFTQTDISAGNLTYDHDGSQTSSDGFGFTVDDGVGAEISGTFNITISNVNDTPVNNVPTTVQVVDEDTPVNIAGISVSDDDDNLDTVRLNVDNGTLTVSLSGTASISAGANGSNDLTLTGSLPDINDALATVTYQGHLHFNGADTLTVLATDATFASDSDVVSITVNSVNDEQVVATNAGATIAEASTGNTITSVLLETTDDDHFPGELTYSVDTVPVNGILRLGGTALSQNNTFTQADISAGIVTYDHDGSQPSSDAFGFTVDDGVGAATSGTFSITISNVNDAPVNNVPTSVQVVDEDTPINITGISVADDDNNLSSVQLTVGNGTLTAALSGPTSISTGANGSNDMTLTGSLADINDTLATVTYQGDLHFNGTDTLTVLATDATLATDSDVVNIAVNAVNDEQVIATNAGTTVAEASTGNVITAILLETTDVDHLTDELTYTVDLATANGTLRLSGTALTQNDTFTQADISAGIVTYDHDGTQTYSDAFDFSVDDGAGATTSGTFNIAISNVNDLPVNTVPASVQMVYEDTPVNITGISVSDDDDNLDSVRLIVGNGTLTVTLSGTASISAGANGSSDLSLTGAINDINDTLATVTYQGDLHFNGTDTLTILATDTSLSTGSDVVNISVNPVNDIPINSGSLPSRLNVTEDILSEIDLSAINFRDVDNSNLTVTLTSSSGGQLTLAADASINFGGTPTARTITGSLADLNTYFNNTSNIQYLHSSAHTNGINADKITVSISDIADRNNGTTIDTVIGIINIDITMVNDSPTLTTIAPSVDEGHTITLSTDVLVASDVDDQAPGALTFTILSLPAHGTLALDGTVIEAGTRFTNAAVRNGLLSYTHDGSETSMDSFEIELRDGGEDDTQPVTGQLSVTINEVIDIAPAIGDESFILPFGSQFDSSNGDILDSGYSSLAQLYIETDPDLEVTLEQEPVAGTVSINSNGNFTYTHNSGALLQDRFQYRVTNSDGEYKIASVLVSIEPPIASAFSKQQTVGQASTPVTKQSEIGVDLEPAQQESIDLERQAHEEVVNELHESFAELQPTAVLATVQQIGDRLEVAYVETHVREPSSDHIHENQPQVINHREQITIGVVVAQVDSISTPLNQISQLEFELDTARKITSSEGFNDALWQLDKETNEADEKLNRRYEVAANTSLGISLSVTAGIFTWFFRGGALFASAIASTPLWTYIDPVSVITKKDKDKDKTNNSESEADELEKYFDVKR